MQYKIKITTWMIFVFCLFTLSLYFKHSFSTYPHIPQNSTTKLLNSNQTYQVILIVVDALRYDFLDQIKNIIKQQFQDKFYYNKLLAGNPTTTTQRIQSFMTGSYIFSYTNLFKAFVTQKSDVDSILYQMGVNNKKSIVLGDSTWSKLFNFSDQKTCKDTFNVFDLDTCDQIIYDNLEKIIQNKQTNYDLIVAHFLAIDHVGHSINSIDNQIMKQKLSKIFKYINNLKYKISNNTILMIVGDHGIKQNGNHGGNSIEQIQTLILAYSKNNQIQVKQSKRQISQCDITATLSLLLNVPLPSNTIGYPIFQLVPSSLIHNQQKEIIRNLHKHYQNLLRFYERQDQREQYINIDLKFVNWQNILNKTNFLKYKYPQSNKIIYLSILLSISFFLLIFIHNNVFNTHFFTIFLQSLFKIISYVYLCVFIISWLLIQNMGSCIILSLLIINIVNFYFVNQCRLIQLLKIIFAILILAQIEPDTKNDYTNNIFRVKIIYQILMMKQLKIISMALFVFFYFQNKRKNYQQITFIHAILILLNFFVYVQPLWSISIYLIKNIALVIITCIFIDKKLKRYKASQFISNQFLLLNLLIYFIGQNYLYFLAIGIFMVKKCNKYQNYPIIINMYSQFIWWSLGNRLQLSGIQVSRTFIFHSQYIFQLNLICLIIYLIAPYLLGLVLLTININNKNRIQILDQENQFICNNNQNKQNLKLYFCIPLLATLISSVWMTFYNSQKLLFTIIYVPMLIIISTITLAVYAITLFTI